MDRPFPKRPPRLERVFASIQRPLYFVTFNTHERQPILANAAVHDAFGAFCKAAPEHGATVGRYVIMPDHVHLFVVLSLDGIPLERWVQSLKAVVGKTLLAEGIPKPHWQQGFFDHLLRSEESYAEKWSYVQMNPVRAGLCSTPDEWPYKGKIQAL